MQVIRFDTAECAWPVVRFKNGITRRILPEEWWVLILGLLTRVMHYTSFTRVMHYTIQPTPLASQ